MTFGILETDPTKGSPPGTELLEKVRDGSKHGADARAILVPQPSESPRDPLNMSSIRKELYFAALIYGACITGVVGPVFVPAFSIVAGSFNIGLTQVTLLNGALIMALGVSSYLCAPLAALWGRRMVYLFTALMMMAGCVWAGYAQAYGSLFGARILQGLGMGAFFCLAGTMSINDVFFVHERGRRAGLWNFAVLVSVNVAPVISGYLITALGWQWSFRILAIAFAVAFILTFVFIPETSFDRRGLLDGQSPRVADHSKIKTDDEAASKGMTMRNSSPVQSAPASLSAVAAPNRTAPVWKKLLGLEDLQSKGIAALFPMLVTPCRLFRHPAVLWGCAMWSVTFSWVIIQGAVADQIFGAPPYNLSPAAIGLLTGISPLIGSSLGTLVGGWLCDFAAQAMAIRNQGIYEPEFRLVVLVPSLITTAIGS